MMMKSRKKRGEFLLLLLWNTQEEEEVHCMCYLPGILCQLFRSGAPPARHRGDRAKRRSLDCIAGRRASLPADDHSLPLRHRWPPPSCCCRYLAMNRFPNHCNNKKKRKEKQSINWLFGKGKTNSNIWTRNPPLFSTEPFSIVSNIAEYRTWLVSYGHTGRRRRHQHHLCLYTSRKRANTQLVCVYLGDYCILKKR